MKRTLVPRSWFFVLRTWCLVLSSWCMVLGFWFLCHTTSFGKDPTTDDAQTTKNQEPSTKNELFRPEVGVFPPVDKGHVYRGELVFVDHANRRGSIRVQGSGMFFRNDPHPIAMLPYGIVNYHGALSGSTRCSTGYSCARLSFPPA